MLNLFQHLLHLIKTKEVGILKQVQDDMLFGSG